MLRILLSLNHFSSFQKMYVKNAMLLKLHLIYRSTKLTQKQISSILSGSFSVGWAKAGIAIVRDPDDRAWLGLLTKVHPKGFGLGPLTAEI